MTLEGECLSTMVAGTAEHVATINQKTVIDKAIADNPGAFASVGAPVLLENLSVALDRASSYDPASLADKLGTIVQRMHDDGTLSRLSLQWFELDLSESSE